jgi:hypothetical protein
MAKVGDQREWCHDVTDPKLTTAFEAGWVRETLMARFEDGIQVAGVAFQLFS